MSDSVRPPWTIAYQAPLSMEFSRQQYWSGLPFLSPGVLPDPGIEPRSPTLQVDSLPSEPLGNPVIKFWFSVMFMSMQLLGQPEEPRSVEENFSLPRGSFKTPPHNSSVQQNWGISSLATQ